MDRQCGYPVCRGVESQLFFFPSIRMPEFRSLTRYAEGTICRHRIRSLIGHKINVGVLSNAMDEKKIPCFGCKVGRYAQGFLQGHSPEDAALAIRMLQRLLPSQSPQSLFAQFLLTRLRRKDIRSSLENEAALAHRPMLLLPQVVQFFSVPERHAIKWRQHKKAVIHPAGCHDLPVFDLHQMSRTSALQTS